MTQAADPHFKPARMLLPMDFSTSSYAALGTAAELAGHFGAELILLNVVPVLPIETGLDSFPEEAMVQQARDFSSERLDESVAALVSRGVKAKARIQMGNDVVGNILLTIGQEGIDLVVISTHGMSGWRAVVFGSIAEKVVKLVECPLLLLRSPKPAGL